MILNLSFSKCNHFIEFILLMSMVLRIHHILQLSALWDYFCFNINGVRPLQSRGALSILCMAAKSSPSILGSHLQDIIDIGFGRWAKEEPLLARDYQKKTKGN
jgi:hypothetical protein